MAMTPLILVASVLSAVSILLLLVLTGVWINNFRAVGSSLTLGLIAFGVVLLLENGLAIAFFLSTSMLYSGDPVAQQAVVTLRALQLLAVGFLTYVTLK